MNELKPCPFCGGAAHFVNTPESESGVCVECERCLTSSRVIYPSKQDPFPELAEAWNRRQSDSITCDEHEWPYGCNIDGDNHPKCVWCECLRADALDRNAVQLTKDLLYCRNHRDAWLWAYSLIVGVVEGVPGWKTSKTAYPIPNSDEILQFPGINKAKELRKSFEQLQFDITKAEGKPL